MKVGLIGGIITIIVSGLILGASAKKENDFFQFCTTKAYGWPTPWKIDYCECEGSKTVYPVSSKVINLSTVFGSGVAGFVIFGGFSLMRSRHQKRGHQE